MYNEEYIRSLVEDDIGSKLEERLHSKSWPVPDYYCLFEFLKTFFSFITPEQINNTKVILKCEVPEGDTGDSYLCEIYEGDVTIDNSTVVLYADKTFQLNSIDYTVNEPAIVYEYKDNKEVFSIGDLVVRPTLYDTTQSSVFSKPTYKGLEEALRSYYQKRARCSSCTLLSSSWIDEVRSRFVNAPESKLRDSLWHFLKDTMRGVEVKREQNVNETEPVDIKVGWTSPPAVALIEIKWLGVSVNPKTKTKTSQYGEERANSGAKQLIDYICEYHQEDTRRCCLGYHVVFDGRRRNHGNPERELIKDELWYYRDSEISYNEECIKDYSKNYRFYMEPRCPA